MAVGQTINGKGSNQTCFDHVSINRNSMKFFAVAALCLLALGAVRADDPTVQLAGVVDLTPSNFDSVINGAKAALIEFYAPWCGHCKRMVSEYKKLGEMVLADPLLRSRVVVAKVDADAHRSLGEKFGVQGFPTIKFLPRGLKASTDNAVAYNSARTADAFLSYLKEQVQKDAGFARVEELDTIAATFTEAEDKGAVVAELKDRVAALSGDDAKNGELYVKLAEKGSEKGSAWLSKERARLEKMLGTGSVSAAKVEEMSKKLSVLGAFLDEPASS